MSIPFEDRMVDEHQAADFLGLAVRTLQNWRSRRCGPPFSKFGRAVRYSVSELARYAQAQQE